MNHVGEQSLYPSQRKEINRVKQLRGETEFVADRSAHTKRMYQLLLLPCRHNGRPMLPHSAVTHAHLYEISLPLPIELGTVDEDDRIDPKSERFER